MNLKIGETAPIFPLPKGLPDQNGNYHQLSDYSGKIVLLYFYPKDDTTGCTTQACGLRDGFGGFSAIEAVILGVSPDSVGSHKKFADKYKLPLTLLADTDKKLAEAYGVWGDKSFMGKKYFGILRTSFLIDRSGKIIKIYEEVSPPMHAKQVLADLQLIK